MSFKLDLKGMKYVKSDDKSTTLKHPKGHTITLAHNVLEPKNREALKALSKVASQAMTKGQAEEAEDQHPYGKIIHKAEGGPVQYAEGSTKVKIPAQGEADSGTRKMEKVKEGAQNSGGGKPPTDSPLSTGDWTHIWKAEGGRVPAPAQSSDAPQQSKTRHETPANVNTPSSAGEAWDRVKNAWAEGGSVCKACGGPIHKYAEGTPDQPINTDDIAGVKQMIPVQPENSPRSIDTAEKRNAYNDIVEGHNTGFFGDPEDYSDVAKTKKQQFGPDGQAPQQFDPDAWNQAVNERAKAKEATAMQLAGEAQKAVKYNQAAADAGLAQKPDAMGMQQPQGQMPQPQQQGLNPHGEMGQQQQGQPQDMFSQTGYNGAVNELAHTQQQQMANQIKQRQAVIDDFDNSYRNLEKERLAHMQDIKEGHIDPSKYWNDHSKIASGIGVILAGFNPTSNPNAALNFLQHQMDKSIEAQTKNLDSENNLLTANMHHFGDLHQATLMTQAMMSDSLAAKMQEAALNSKNPLAKQAALGASAQLMQNAMNFQRQLAMQQTMMKLMGGGDTNPERTGQAIGMMSAVNPEGAKVYRDAFVPGVGMSKSLTPIPESVREQIASGQKLQNATVDLLNYSKNHTNLNPLSGEYKVGAQKALILQQLVREGMLGTVFRDSEKPLLEAFVAENPAGALKRINSDPKLKTLLESSINSLNSLKQTYGLPQQQQPQNQSQMQPVVRKTPDGREALFNPQTKQFLGYK